MTRRSISILLIVCAASLPACGSSSGGSSPSEGQVPPAVGTTPDRDAPTGGKPPAKRTARSLDLMLGQKIMVAFRGSLRPPASLLRRIERGHVGGVILFSENVPGDGAPGVRRTVRTLRAAARRGGNPPLLIATDQEGGDVRRVPGPPVRAPREIGAGPTRAARTAGVATGRSLRSMGIDVDLAPVVDLPRSPGSFLGMRTFSTAAGPNTRHSVGFARGLQRARVAATAKHYPGLGSAGAITTDVASVRIRASRETMGVERAGFLEHARAGVRLIMMSNAVYDAYDSRRPAVVSARMIGRLRDDGFRGVVISDELNVPALRGYGRRLPGLATAAGVDILLYANTDGSGVLEALRRDVRAGRLSRARIERQVARIIALKRWLARGR